MVAMTRTATEAMGDTPLDGSPDGELPREAAPLSAPPSREPGSDALDLVLAGLARSSGALVDLGAGFAHRAQSWATAGWHYGAVPVLDVSTPELGEVLDGEGVAAVLLAECGAWPQGLGAIAATARALVAANGSPPLVTDATYSAGELAGHLRAAGFGPLTGIDEVDDGVASRRVRLWELGSRAGPAPAVTVILRTQGRRPAHLREALLCLAAQTDQDFEVCITVHGATTGQRANVEGLVAEQPRFLRRRLRVLAVDGAGRGRPLNAGVAAARGGHVVFLDDDDLVGADWISGFRAAAASYPDAVVRALAARQEVAAAGPDDRGPYRVLSGFSVPYHRRFDLVEHLVDNQSPICTIALPTALLEASGIRFDEDLAALEDWDVLTRCAAIAGVRDTGTVTSVYHWWIDDSGSAAVAGPRGWAESRDACERRLARAGLPLGPQATSQLLTAVGRYQALRVELAELRHAHDGRGAELDAARARVAHLESKLRLALSARAALRGRGAPFSRLAGVVRRSIGRVRPSMGGERTA